MGPVVVRGLRSFRFAWQDKAAELSANLLGETAATVLCTVLLDGLRTLGSLHVQALYGTVRLNSPYHLTATC